jgi:hypothetical protein
MGSVISSVRSHITQIMNSNRRFRNYVIATYGDPYRRNVRKTTSKASVSSFIRGLRAYGGGDCPEFALSGVRDAAASADSNSILFLFTDASAKDASLRNSVASQLKSKNIRFYAIVSGNLCRRSGSEYYAIASATGGKVAKMGNSRATSSVSAQFSLVFTSTLFTSFTVQCHSHLSASHSIPNCNIRTVSGTLFSEISSNQPSHYAGHGIYPEGRQRRHQFLCIPNELSCSVESSQWK